MIKLSNIPYTAGFPLGVKYKLTPNTQFYDEKFSEEVRAINWKHNRLPIKNNAWDNVAVRIIKHSRVFSTSHRI